VRAVVAIALLIACHSDRAKTTLDAYDRVVTEACRCRDAACAETADRAWLAIGASGDHPQLSDAQKSWLLQLGLYFEQCRQRARGESVETVDQ
jgi:hypothetical protein